MDMMDIVRDACDALHAFCVFIMVVVAALQGAFAGMLLVLALLALSSIFGFSHPTKEECATFAIYIVPGLSFVSGGLAWLFADIP